MLSGTLAEGFTDLTISQNITSNQIQSMKKKYLFSLILPVTISLFSASLLGQPARSENSFDLLEIHGLKGWKVPRGNEITKWYEVTNNILKLRSGPNKKGSILWTEKNYQDFELNLEFRFVDGTIDSGIHLRNSDQIQIGISGSLKRDMTCSPYIPGKGYPVEAKNVAKLLKTKDWNQMKIRAVGPKYTTWLQGKEMMNYESDSAKTEGPIGIQLHGNRNMKIDFRNVTVREL